jgi:hypothetical protein
MGWTQHAQALLGPDLEHSRFEARCRGPLPLQNVNGYPLRRLPVIDGLTLPLAHIWAVTDHSNVGCNASVCQTLELEPDRVLAKDRDILAFAAREAQNRGTSFTDLEAASAQYSKGMSHYHCDLRSDGFVVAKPLAAVVLAIDACSLGMQIRTKRRRRNSAGEALPPPLITTYRVVPASAPKPIFKTLPIVLASQRLAAKLFDGTETVFEQVTLVVRGMNKSKDSNVVGVPRRLGFNFKPQAVYTTHYDAYGTDIDGHPFQELPTMP